MVRMVNSRSNKIEKRFRENNFLIFIGMDELIMIVWISMDNNKIDVSESISSKVVYIYEWEE